MENQTAARSTPGRLLLDGVPTLRRACDLDLLLFFARRPVSLLTSEQLAAFVGYGHDEFALQALPPDRGAARGPLAEAG